MKRLEPVLGERLEALDESAELWSEEVSGREVRGLSFEGEQLEEGKWSRMRLVGCRFSGCVFTDCDWTDLVFQDCDLSNCVLERCRLTRCVLEGSKAVGLSAIRAGLSHVLLKDCQLRYANFNGSRLSQVEAAGCDLTEGLWSEVVWKGTEFRDCRMCRTNFFHTPLAGLDFTSCTLEGLVISDTARELRGLTVRWDQAAELARLLGLNVV